MVGLVQSINIAVVKAVYIYLLNLHHYKGKVPSKAMYVAAALSEPRKRITKENQHKIGKKATSKSALNSRELGMNALHT